MFEKILFATSATAASDHAARVAFNLAGRYRSRLTIFHVLGMPTRGYSQQVLDVRTGEKVALDDDYIAWVQEELKVHYRNQLAAAEGLAVEIEVGVGVPHREILRRARAEAPDLIVLGGSTGDRDDSVYKKVLAGSTVHRVAKAAFCPVLVVARPAASFWGGGFSSVVFGTDFSKAADAAFDFALQAARTLDGELHLFHALDIGDVQMGAMVDQDAIERRLREARRRMRACYLPRMEDFQRYSMDAWEGIPYVEIVKYAREKQADLIVLAHHLRADDPEEIRLNSNLEQVIVRAACPVMSVNRAPRKG